MKANRSGGIVLLMHILLLDGELSFMPWLLYPQGKSPQCPWNSRLGGHYSQPGHFGEEKNLL
jgi:hypothetical protein